MYIILTHYCSKYIIIIYNIVYTYLIRNINILKCIYFNNYTF